MNMKDLGGSAGGTFEIAPEDKYLCRFKEVEATMEPDFDNPTLQVPKFKWVFEAVDAQDSEGNPYRFVKFTGRNFGGDRANLTKLMDGMHGRRISDEEFENLRPEDLKRGLYSLMVSQTVNRKGNPRNEIVSIKPVRTGSGGDQQQRQPNQNRQPQQNRPQQNTTMGQQARSGNPAPRQRPNPPADNDTNEDAGDQMADFDDPFAE